MITCVFGFETVDLMHDKQIIYKAWYMTSK
jgi:hypothetical protein